MPRLPSLTVADLVSLSRLALAGAFVVARGSVARLALIAASGATDYLDGWLARRRGETSAFGAMLDPATDRVFVLVVVATLLLEGTLTLAQTLILMARDIVTTMGVIIVRSVERLRSLPIEARWSGKTVTALQFVALIGAIADPRTIPWLLGLVAVASVASIADYSAAAWRSRGIVAIAVLAAVPAGLGAQGMPGIPGSDLTPRFRVEGRADAFLGRVDALHGGIGVATDLGTYFRLAGILGAGAARGGGETNGSGRAEIVGRFLLDPYRQARWGLYGGAGVLARHERGP